MERKSTLSYLYIEKKKKGLRYVPRPTMGKKKGNFHPSRQGEKTIPSLTSLENDKYCAHLYRTSTSAKGVFTWCKGLLILIRWGGETPLSC